MEAPNLYTDSHFFKKGKRKPGNFTWLTLLSSVMTLTLTSILEEMVEVKYGIREE